MDFVGKRRWFFLVSLVIIGAGIISMAVPPSFQIGIEFTGGSAISITFADPVEQEELRTVLGELDHEEAVIQGLGGTSYLIRTTTLEEVLPRRCRAAYRPVRARDHRGRPHRALPHPDHGGL